MLWLKRLLLLTMSLMIGLIATWFVVSTHIILPITNTQLTLGVTFAQFGIVNSVLTTLFVGLAAALWLDQLLGTQILPS